MIWTDDWICIVSRKEEKERKPEKLPVREGTVHQNYTNLNTKFETDGTKKRCQLSPPTPNHHYLHIFLDFHSDKKNSGRRILEVRTVYKSNRRWISNEEGRRIWMERMVLHGRILDKDQGRGFVSL